MNEPTSPPVSRLAREAEIHDREAIAEIEAAQHPTSEGGPHITPREAVRIRLHVLKSAVLDNEAANLAESASPFPDSDGREGERPNTVG
jgi:hypothetical protein